MHQTTFQRIAVKGRDLSASYVSIGPGHALAAESSKTIPYSWGSNASGQLGLGKTEPVEGQNVSADHTSHLNTVA